jgi:hypothetical protein
MFFLLSRKKIINFNKFHFPNPSFFFNFFPRVLDRVVKEKITEVPIVPNWKGQVWLKKLKELSVRNIPLGKSEKILELVVKPGSSG